MLKSQNGVHQKKQLKKFYKTVTVEKIDNVFHLRLDGQTAKTPAKNLLSLSSEQAVLLVCEEWSAQEESIDPSSMHITRMVVTAIDYVSKTIDQVQDEIAKYAESDLLYYRASEPPRLVLRQSEFWNPVLDWASEKFSIQFNIIQTINFKPQPPETIKALTEQICVISSPVALSAFYTLLTIGGSLIAALAVANRHLSAEKAYTICELEPDFTNEIWGIDEEAQIRRAHREKEFIAAAKLLLASKLF